MRQVTVLALALAFGGSASAEIVLRDLDVLRRKADAFFCAAGRYR